MSKRNGEDYVLERQVLTFNKFWIGKNMQRLCDITNIMTTICSQSPILLQPLFRVGGSFWGKPGLGGLPLPPGDGTVLPPPSRRLPAGVPRPGRGAAARCLALLPMWVLNSLANDRALKRQDLHTLQVVPSTFFFFEIYHFKQLRWSLPSESTKERMENTMGPIFFKDFTYV